MTSSNLVHTCSVIIGSLLCVDVSYWRGHVPQLYCCVNLCCVHLCSLDGWSLSCLEPLRWWAGPLESRLKLGIMIQRKAQRSFANKTILASESVRFPDGGWMRLPVHFLMIGTLLWTTHIVRQRGPRCIPSHVERNSIEIRSSFYIAFIWFINTS